MDVALRLSGMSSRTGLANTCCWAGSRIDGDGLVANNEQQMILTAKLVD
jgi:hypothetical protein